MAHKPYPYGEIVVRVYIYTYLVIIIYRLFESWLNQKLFLKRIKWLEIIGVPHLTKNKLLFYG